MKKIILIVLVLIIASIIAVLAMGNIFNLFPGATSTTSEKPSTTPPTSEPPAIPPSNTTQVPPLTTITYDFNNGIPVLSEGQNTPFNQKVGGLTAYFSSRSDPTAFSIQSYDTTFYKLSQFSGNYLFDNKAMKNTLEIKFSQTITSISLTFATVEYHGVGNVDEPSVIKLTAYLNSTQLTLIGSATAQGVFSSDFYPQGTLSYNGNGKEFNQITIELPQQKGSTTEFFVDTIVVTPSQ
jgi:hypothetical protein